VGFAFGIDDVAWALERAGKLRALPARILMVGEAPEIERALRALDLAVARAPDTAVDEYARAFRYTHRLEVGGSEPRLVSTAGGAELLLPGTPERVAELIHQALGPRQ
jgi:hypothetical protein